MLEALAAVGEPAIAGLARAAADRLIAAGVARPTWAAVLGSASFEGAWAADPIARRRDARLELAAFLVHQGMTTGEEAELVPLTGTVGEMRETFQQTKRVADGVVAEMGVPVKYLVGTMIEVPRAALIAHKLVEHAEFFSFGTNDLTQLTFGYSRDDAGTFCYRADRVQ